MKDRMQNPLTMRNHSLSRFPGFRNYRMTVPRSRIYFLRPFSIRTLQPSAASDLFRPPPPALRTDTSLSVNAFGVTNPESSG